MLEVLAGLGVVLVALVLYLAARRQSCWELQGIPRDEGSWRQRLAEALAGREAGLSAAHRRGAARFLGLGGRELLLRAPELARRLLPADPLPPRFLPESHPLVLAAATAPVAALHERPNRLDAARLAADYSAAVVASALLGAEPDSELQARLATLPRADPGSFLGRLFPCLAAPQSFSKHLTYLEHFIQETIEKRKASRLVRKDLIHYLLEATDKKLNQALDTDDMANSTEGRAALVSQSLELAKEGLERVRGGVAALMADLAQDLEVQARARQEVLSLVAKHGALTAQALEEARFLHSCVQESGRLHPVARSLETVLSQDTELEEGVKVPAGTRVVASQAGLSLDPEIFPEPHAFQPQRSPDASLLPSTPGAKFSELAVKTFVAVLLKNFQLTLSPESVLPDSFDHLLHQPDQILLNLAVLN